MRSGERGRSLAGRSRNDGVTAKEAILEQPDAGISSSAHTHGFRSTLTFAFSPGLASTDNPEATESAFWLGCAHTSSGYSIELTRR